jgi:deoxyribodipyrimidine photo-lyase
MGSPPLSFIVAGILFELLWRDFFQYTTFKYSSSAFSSLFDPLGFSDQISTYPANERPKVDWHTPNWDDPDDPARRWCEGRTGVPFVDGCMRELRETGYMSNRGRQNVASFLTKDL